MTRPPEHRDLIDEVERLRQRVERLETRTRTVSVTKTFVIVGEFDLDLFIPPIFVGHDADNVRDQSLDLRGVFAYIGTGAASYQLLYAPVIDAARTYGDEELVLSGSVSSADSPPAHEDASVTDLSFGDRFRLALSDAVGAADLSVSLIFDHTPS